MPSRPIGKLSQEEILRRAELTVRALELQADVEDAVAQLHFFLQLAWPVMQPGVPFQDNWHLSCLCEHLEALSRREIRKLIINLPPRSLKSTLCSVAFPAWRWLHEPSEKFLMASYSLALAKRDSRRCRNLIASQWFQARWGDKFALAADQNEKGRFENDRGGFRLATSVEGGLLGEGATIAVYEDPNDIDRMLKEPDSYPQSVRDWYSGTASTRNIDPRTDCRLCIQQRSSFGQDLTDYLLELGGWDQLVIPNEWEGVTMIGPLKYTDPRTHHGELMFPARLGPDETAVLKREQRVHYPGQFQQKPAVAGKSGLKREWFRFYNPPGTTLVDETGQPLPIHIMLGDGTSVQRTPVELPAVFEQIVQSWDLAFKSGDENDYVAGHAWARFGANSYLLSRRHGHWNFPETLAQIREMTQQFPCPEKLVEDKANGPAVIDTLKNEVPGLIPVNPSGGKFARTAAIAGYVEAGNIYLPNPTLHSWVWDLLAEFSAGQSAKYFDDGDAMSQGLKRLYDASSRAGVPEFRVAPRLGMNEPSSACHIAQEAVPAWFRHFCVVTPGKAALWMAETPTGSLRVLQELLIDRLDALQAGRELARRILPDLLARRMSHPNVQSIKKGQPGYEIFLPKLAFAPVEPIGCWAEMMEQALLAWEPENGDFDARNLAAAAIREARIRCDMVEEEDAALDRLRGLLAFAPPDFKPQDYDRDRALALAESDIYAYHAYMAMCRNEVHGEWPKLKISPACPQLIAELGSFRKDLDPGPFVAGLLLGVSAPKTVPDKPEIHAVPWPAATASRRSPYGRKFARR